MVAATFQTFWIFFQNHKDFDKLCSTAQWGMRKDAQVKALTSSSGTAPVWPALLTAHSSPSSEQVLSKEEVIGSPSTHIKV